MGLEKLPAVGQQAADFTLSSAMEEKVTLSSFQGQVVLLAFVSSST